MVTESNEGTRPPDADVIDPLGATASPELPTPALVTPRASTLESSPVVPSDVAREAREARDPRMMGIVLSRMFGGDDEDEAEAQKIGRFTLLDRLGEGGMGVVYAAYDDELDRKVAVKVLRTWAPGHDDASSAASQRLLQEARAMAKLSHPNIVSVHEVGTHDGEVFVAMEYVRGQSLERWLLGPEQGPPGQPWREVVRVFQAAGRGLAAAHRAGIVHRDFKPHNVMLGDDGVPKVLDFGLARLTNRPSFGPSESATEPADSSKPTPSLTRTGALMGTPAYMSPEQYEGKPADERSDQFSFFASLYHALYQQLPFTAESVSELILAITEGHVGSPPADSVVPRWLHRAVLQGLKTDPAARYPSMEAAIAAIVNDPAARRRQWLGIGGLCVAVAGTSVAVASALDSPPPAAPPACEQGQQEMARIWDEDARAGIERALEALELPFARATWERLEPRLDDYAQTWATTRDEACAAHRDGAHSTALYDLEVACLERRQASFEAIIELLQQPDRTVVERALPAVASLPPLAYCRDADALLAAVPPPEDPAIAQRVEEQRHHLARAREQEALGQYEAGSKQLRELLLAAEPLGYRPLLAEIMVRQGSITMEYGAPADAERMLTDALTHALASGHVEAATEAVARRLFVRAERMRALERAADDVTLGAGLVEHEGAPARLRGLYLNNVGAYHLRQEDHQAARETLLRALELERTTLGPDDPELTSTLANLAVTEERTGHYDQARTYLDEALALAERTLGPEHPKTAGIARFRGELLFRIGHLRDAREALEPVLETLGHTVGPRSLLRHSPMTMLGEIALVERRYDQALEWFQRAAELERPEDESGETYRIFEDAGLGRALVGLGQTERGWATLRDAVARAERLEAPYTPALWELLGRTLLLHGQPEAALVELRRSQQSEVAAGQERSYLVALSLEAQGRALHALDRLDEAEATLAEALSIFDELDGFFPERSEVLVARSRVALAQARRNEATAHARAALDDLASWGQPDHLTRARAQAALALALAAGSPSDAEQREAGELARLAAHSLSTYADAFSSELAELEPLIPSPAPP